MTPLLVTAPARIRPSRGIVATSRCHWFVLGSYMSTDFSLSRNLISTNLDPEKTFIDLHGERQKGTAVLSVEV